MPTPVRPAALQGASPGSSLQRGQLRFTTIRQLLLVRRTVQQQILADQWTSLIASGPGTDMTVSRDPYEHALSELDRTDRANGYSKTWV